MQKNRSEFAERVSYVLISITPIFICLGSYMAHLYWCKEKIRQEINVQGIIYWNDKPKASVVFIDKKACRVKDVLDSGAIIEKIKENEVILRYKIFSFAVHPKRHSKRKFKDKVHSMSDAFSTLRHDSSLQNRMSAMKKLMRLGHKNFSRVNFSRADLKEIDLSSCYLDWADLTNANLNGANLTDACLLGVNLDNASLKNVILKNADLRYAKNLTVSQLGECLNIENIKGLDTNFLHKLKKKSPSLMEWWEPNSE